MNLYRKHALELFAWKEISQLTNTEREEILTDIFSGNDEYELIKDFTSEKYNSLIVDYFIQTNAGVKNTFIEEKLSKLYLIETNIIGNPDILHACYCCEFLALKTIGEYEICPVCFWEDDGTKHLQLFSQCNKRTLLEGKLNYKEYGAIDIMYVNKVEKGEEKYSHL